MLHGVKLTPEQQELRKQQHAQEIAQLDNKTMGTHQPVRDTAVLLQRLAEVCIELLGLELLGTSFKHGLNPINEQFQEHRAGVAWAAIKLLQETGMSKEELLRIWEEVKKDE